MSTTVDVNIKVTGAKKAASEVSGIGEAAERSSETMDSLSGAADNMTGGLVTGMKGGFKSIKRVIKGMRTLKGALIASGVGALIVVLGSLYAWATKTQEGVSAMNVAMSTTSMIWNDLTTKAGKNAGSWIDGVSTALGNLAKSVSELSNNKGNADGYFDPFVKAAKRLEVYRLKEIEDNKELIKSSAEYTATIDEQRIIMNDTTKSFGDKQLAMGKLHRASEELSAAETTKHDVTIARLKLVRTTQAEGSDELIETNNQIAQSIAAKTKAIGDHAKNIAENDQKSREAWDSELGRQQTISSIIQSALTSSITNERKQLQQQQDDVKKSTLAEMERLKATAADKEQFLRAHNAVTSKILKDYDDDKEAQRILDSEALAAKLKADQDKIDAAQKVKDDKEQADLNAKYERQDELDAFFNTEQENEIAAVTAQYEKLFGLAYEFEMDTEELTRRQGEANAAINKKYADQEIAEDKKVQTEKQANRQEALNAGMDAAASMVNFLAEMNEAADGASVQEQKKAFERNKKLQISQALISASRGIINILSNSSTIPDPWGTIYKGVQIGMLAGVTAKQISKIKSTQFSGGGSVSDGGGGGGAAALPQMTQGLVPSSFGDSATAPTSGSSTEIAPVQAFVVSSSVTNQQQLDAQISHQSSL